MVNKDISECESMIIENIVDRYLALSSPVAWVAEDSRATLIECLSLCHCNGCPLDLVGLLDAPEFSLKSDILGIYHNLGMATGILRRGFVPRYKKEIK